MTIQDWGAVGEIIGGIAVVITLIYLVVQIRESTRATHRNMYSSASADVSRFWLELAKDMVLYEDFTQMLRDPESMDQQNRDRAYLVMDSFLSLLESYFLHNRDYGEVLSQERWGRMLARFFGTPGGREYWQARRNAYQDEFAEYLNEIVENARN